MGKNSKIEWTDHTFSPWWGCSRVSPACDHCYAAVLAHRVWPRQDLWNAQAPVRRFFGDKHWAEPLKWEREAIRTGTRPRVFCASMADVFDNADGLGAQRIRLWRLIRETPHLDWLLLTKRIGNAKHMLPWISDDGRWAVPWPNVWLGISVVTQAEVDRDVPKLKGTPAHLRFLSCEPLIEPINLTEYLEGGWSGLHWVIIGGESGQGARPMLARWAFNLISECMAFNVPVFFKQGSQANWSAYKDMATWPEACRVREFPNVNVAIGARDEHGL